jgi:hypothetical protein
MAASVHRPLKVIAFNANGIWRRRYELSKQLQDLHMDVALLSETCLKEHEGFFIPNYYFYRIYRFPVRKGIPYNRVDLRYMCDTYIWQSQNQFIIDKPILWSEEMLHKDYVCKGSRSKKSLDWLAVNRQS